MKDKNGEIQRQWSRAAFAAWTGKRWRIDDDAQIPKIIVRLDRLVQDIAESNEVLFTVGTTRRGKEVVCATVLGKRVLQCVTGLDVAAVRRYLTRHRFSPYFELWEHQRDELHLIREHSAWVGAVAYLNEWVDRLRAEARALPFRRMVHNQERVARKNWQSFQRFLDALFRRHAKLLVLRVDAGFRTEPPEIWARVERLSDAQVKQMIRKLLRFIRRKLPPLVGYAWKIEYGAAKWHHCHLMLFLDGHLAREGITWGRVVGEEWARITSQLGTYWNCNADIETYRRRGLLGIGLIHYGDQDLRAGLERTARYLVKADYYARFVSPEIGRTFGKSVIRPRADRRGRPRLDRAPRQTRGRPLRRLAKGRNCAPFAFW